MLRAFFILVSCGHSTGSMLRSFGQSKGATEWAMLKQEWNGLWT